MAQTIRIAKVVDDPGACGYASEMQWQCGFHDTAVRQVYRSWLCLGVILQVPGAVGVLDAEVKKPELWELCSFRLDPSLRLGSAC